MSLAFNTTLQFDNFQRGYNIAMFAMWGLAIDIPRLVVRYGKAYPLAINIHSILMVMIGLLTEMYLIAEISMYRVKYGSSYSGLLGLPYAQFVMSIILGCFIFIQFILGFIVRVELFKNQKSKYLFNIKTAHKISGYILIIYGKIVVTFIILISSQDIIFRAWLFGLGGLGIVLLILQVLYRSQSKSIVFVSFFQHKNKYQKHHTQIYNSLLDKKEKFKDYKDKGIRYVIIDNNMYYIDENFMHPGGQYIFSLINGREINYYLKGAKAIAPEYPTHQHSKYVAKYLQNRLVGQLSVEPLVTHPKKSSQNPDWKIVQTVKSQFPGGYAITFECDSGQVEQNFKIQNFGKYIMMGCSTEQILSKTERPYYICNSICEKQRLIMDRYRNYYKYYYFKEDIQQQQIQDEKDEKDEKDGAKRLTFFIKQHKKGLFTRYLLNAPKDRLFNINGPYGKGLHIKEKTSSYYLIIAAGIGIVPFTDLFTYLLQKTLYDLIKVKASNPSLRKINENQINYQPLSNIKILLVGSFTSSQKFYLCTTIKQLFYLNKKHNLKTFNMMLRYQNAQIEPDVKMIKQNFNKDFLANLLEEEQPDRIIFSGPLTLEAAIRKYEPQFKLKTSIQYL